MAALLVVVTVVSGGCSQAGGQDVSAAQRGVFQDAPTTSMAPDAPTTSTTPVAPTTSPAAVPPTTSTPAVPPTSATRVVHEQQWTAFASVGGIVLRHPSARVERIGYHESNHDGAQQLEPLPTSAQHLTLEPRARSTGARTAADVMVDPDSEIRSPVSGRVLHAGTYVLYCDYRDDFVVIEPEDQPGLEVKVLHIDGVAVRSGERVRAGETVLAPRATRLPFDSQVEETSARPAWPHVHIEVIDPSIPDRPSGRGG